jgi:transposase
MRKLKEVLRLKYEQNLSYQDIAKSVNIAKSTVYEYISRAENVTLSWPLPPEMDDDALENLLYPNEEKDNRENESLPNFQYIHQELPRKGVTLKLLWQEYASSNPDGLRYSRFCDRYRNWAKTCNLWMPQVHKAGEKTFVDYAGQTMTVYESSGSSEAQIFVSSLGASTYIYSEATPSQKMSDWISSHENMFNFYGGVTEVLVPDNLKSGVTKAHRYEPDINIAYQEMAKHYNVAVIPARVVRPKDKSKVEGAVQLVERQVLAPLRNQRFYSFTELNQAIGERLKIVNNQPFQKISGSRHSLYLELDKPMLKPLPLTPFAFAEWKKDRVKRCYHINIASHWYSVPYLLVDQMMEIRFTDKTIEIFYKGKLVAAHLRNYKINGYTTNLDHMPPGHRAHAECTPEKLIEQAHHIGQSTEMWIKAALERPDFHPLQSMKTCLGVLRLAKQYNKDRLEKACKRALIMKAFTFKSIESILQNGLDHHPFPHEIKCIPLPQTHEFVRGKEYYLIDKEGEQNVIESNY